MIEITAEIRALIDKAAAGVELAGDEYIDPADGLIHCKKCGGQRQTVVPCFGNPATLCPAASASASGRLRNSARLLKNGSAAWSVSNAERHRACKTVICMTTFANDNGQNPLMDKARAYVENWKEAYKTTPACCCLGMWNRQVFFAGCIANALLDQDVPVLMTNFPTI